MNFSYYMPTKILFGPDSLNNLEKETLPGSKALIITGGTSTTKLGYVKRVQELLRGNLKNSIDSIVYDKVQPNPTKKGVEQCAKLFSEGDCDFIIGLGGGSSIDTAKAVSVLASNGGDYWDYISGGSGKSKKLDTDPFPVIAITTTAGTGTESDPWTVITKEETNEKIGFGNEKTFPYLSIVDPKLMSTVPPHLTAYQGFDALFHATEGYIANIATPMSDMFALKSIELIGRYLSNAVNDGNDIEARSNVALANTLSGFVETLSSCTSEHSLEHALSAFYPKLPHGAGLIMISLEYYKKFLDVCPQRLIDMAKALGKHDAYKAYDFIDALYELQKACNVDKLKMSDYSIDPECFESYGKNAMDTMSGLFTCDRTSLSLSDICEIYQNSYK